MEICPNRYMKKLIIVNNANWAREITIDSSIFTKYHIEACTRALDENIKSGDLSVAPYIFSTLKNSKKTYVFNSYIILVNAGYHTYAENLRKSFRNQSRIDLKYEPIKG